MTTDITTVLHLRADNDTYGNPRRVYVGLNATGASVAVTDEGYGGVPEWVSTWQQPYSPSARFPYMVDVTPKEYRRVLKAAKERGTLR